MRGAGLKSSGGENSVAATGRDKGRSPANGSAASKKSKPVKRAGVAKARGAKGYPGLRGGLAKLGAGNPDIARALAELQASGRLTSAPSRKISARIDEGVLAAAAQRLGMEGAHVSDVVNASLAMVAAPDRFKQWLSDPKEVLSEDFELAI